MKYEKVLVDVKEIALVRGGLFKKTTRIFERSKISHLRYLNPPKLTRHPLAGDHFDYLGFQTDQMVINEAYGDDRIAFDYEGATISFGDDVYSWQFDELSDALQKTTGHQESH